MYLSVTLIDGEKILQTAWACKGIKLSINGVYEALFFLCPCARTGNEATNTYILNMCLQ